MISLEELYYCASESQGPPSAACQMANERHSALMEQVEALDKELSENLFDACSDLLEVECRAMFREGLRLGLEFLKL